MFGTEWAAHETEDPPEPPASRDRRPAKPINVYRTALVIAGLLIAVWAIHANLPRLIPRT